MATFTRDSGGKYIVKQGDTLSKIASMQGRSLQDLLENNPQFAANPNAIKAGDFVIGPKGMYGETDPVGTPGAYNYAFPHGGNNLGGGSSWGPDAPTPTTKSTPSYSSLTGSSSSSSNTNSGSSFTEALIKMLRDAQNRDVTGQAALMKQSQGITGQGLQMAKNNFNNVYLDPSSGTAYGKSAQNVLEPLQLSIENQRELASRNLENIGDTINTMIDAYPQEKSSSSKSASTKVTGGYTAQEQRKLRAAGIDVNDIGAADEYLYGEGDTTEFLDPAYFEQLFGEDGLKEAAGSSGYRHWYTPWGTEKQKYLDYLMSTVNSYREAGYTDKEILKLMS